MIRLASTPQPEPTVSASKAEKSRFWVAFFLDDLPEGTFFKPGKLHITLAPWFVCDKDDEEIIGGFEKFDFGKRFNIVVGTESKFGPKKDVPVNLVESTTELNDLHLKTLDFFKTV